MLYGAKIPSQVLRRRERLPLIVMYDIRALQKPQSKKNGKGIIVP